MSLTAILLSSVGIGAVGGLAAAKIWHGLKRAHHWSEYIVVALFNGCGVFFLSALVIALVTRG